MALEIKRKELIHLATESDLPEYQWKTKPLTPSKEDYDAFVYLNNIKNNIVSFVNEGKHLFICSKQVGNGKTSFAIKLMLQYFKEIWAGNGLQTRAKFVHTPKLLYLIKDFNNPKREEYLEELKKVDLVIFDDIAIQKLTDFEYNLLLMIIDERILSNKSCIFTSNITTLEELSNVLGVRLASRVYNTSKKIEFLGKDRRGWNNND